MPLMECCLHLFACDIHVELYSKASFGASVVGNIIEEFVLHGNICVPGLLELAFGQLPNCVRRSAPTVQ